MLPLHTQLCVGFGDCLVLRDGQVVWREEVTPTYQSDQGPLLSWIERRAQRDPEHEWRLVFHEALWHKEYVRQGDCWWELAHSDMGFA